MTSKVKNDFSDPHFIIIGRSSSIFSVGEVLYGSYEMHEFKSAPLPTRCGRGALLNSCISLEKNHMTEPYGKAILPHGNAIWQCHMAVPYCRSRGRGRGLGVRLSMETFSLDFDPEKVTCKIRKKLKMRLTHHGEKGVALSALPPVSHLYIYIYIDVYI